MINKYKNKYIYFTSRNTFLIFEKIFLLEIRLKISNAFYFY